MNDLLESRTEAAKSSEGRSASPILEMVSRIVREQPTRADRLIDVGCGHGDLFAALRGAFGTYVGCDLVRYERFPTDPVVEFKLSDLNGAIPVDTSSADLVVSVETIEHLENPRAFLRELTRIARPSGMIVVTTPNQLSFLSKLSLVLKNRFAAFHDVHYPAHIVALLESDLLRIANEAGLVGARIVYSDQGRIPGTPRSWPRALKGRAFSDNLALVGRKLG
jgi:2-polyprenyl-3-methyl-5-hydroxy-6-metoxy-1,4-benzoquinol methylase